MEALPTVISCYKMHFYDPKEHIQNDFSLMRRRRKSFYIKIGLMNVGIKVIYMKGLK